MNILKRIRDSFREPTEIEAATVIENFVGGTSGPWDWDDFSVKYKNETVEAARAECLKVQHDFPGGAMQWCSEQGIERLREIAIRLRNAAH